MFSKLFRNKAFILIIIVSVLSIWQILRLYFSYEDFAFFYTFLFPKESVPIIASSGVSRHHAVYWFIYPLFKLLGYKPFGYYLLAFILFVIYNIFYFLFLKKIYPKNSKLALYATLIQASLYVGIDGFVWNMTVGPEILLFLIFSLFTFFGLINFIKTRKIIHLLIFVFLYLFTIYFFPFRSYFLFSWLPLYIFFLVPEEKKNKTILYLISFFLVVVGIGLLKWILVKFGNSISFVDLNLPYLFKIFLKDISYVFPFYNLIFTKDLFIAIKGFIILIFILLIPLIFKKEKEGLSNIIWFFSLSFLSSLIMMMTATQFIGLIADVWGTSHWFYLTMLPMIAGVVASILFAMEKKFNNPRTSYVIVFIIVVVNIFLTNMAISFRVRNHSNPLRYFYTSIKKEIPFLSNKNLIILNISGSPRALNPFVSGTDYDGIINLAGYYNLPLKDLNYAFSPKEGVDLIVKKNLNLANVYSIDYIKDSFTNTTDEFRKILKNGKTLTIGKSFFGKDIEISNLKLTVSTPFYLKIKAKIVKMPPEEKPTKDNYGNYLNVFFNQNKKTKLYKVTTNGLDNLPEQNTQNIIDGNYDTYWILKNWLSHGSEINIDLGQVLNVDKIVWATARNSPWFLRSISAYQISSSLDGKDYEIVKNVDDAKYLDRGEFFVDTFPTQRTRFIKINISKTHGGWTPAIDEIEVFENSEKIDDFNKYFEMKKNIFDYLSNEIYLNKYLSEVLGYKIPVKISWKNEYNESFSSNNVREFQIDIRNGYQTFNILIPKTGREINAIRFEVEKYPSQLSVYSIEIRYPSLDDFKYDNIFRVEQ